MYNTPFRYPFAIFSLLISLGLSAQVDNYLPGYLVTVNGERISGLVNEESDLRLSQGIRFRANDEANIQYFRPMEVLEVGFNDSAKVLHPITHSYTLVGTGTDNQTTRLATLLLAGPLPLYRLAIPADECYRMESQIPTLAYYLQVSSGEFIKLEQLEQDVNDPNSTAQYVVREAYKDVLRFLWQDWPGLEHNLRSTKFRDQDMIALVQAYTTYHYGFSLSPKTPVRPRKRVQHVLQFNLLPAPRFLDRRDLRLSLGAGYYLKFNNASIDNGLSWGLGVEYQRISFPEWPKQAGSYLHSGASVRVPLLAEYYVTRQAKTIQPRFKVLLIPAWQHYEGDHYRLRSAGGTAAEAFKTYQVSDFDVFLGVGVGADLGRWRLDVQYETKAFVQLGIGYYLRK